MSSGSLLWQAAGDVLSFLSLFLSLPLFLPSGKRNFSNVAPSVVREAVIIAMNC